MQECFQIPEQLILAVYGTFCWENTFFDLKEMYIFVNFRKKNFKTPEKLSLVLLFILMRKTLFLP